jgi:hypothetical protein
MQESTAKPASRPKPPKNPYKKALDLYYASLKDFQYQQTLHEGAVSSAFQFLLAEAARTRRWTSSLSSATKSAEKIICPDGTSKTRCTSSAAIESYRREKSSPSQLFCIPLFPKLDLALLPRSRHLKSIAASPIKSFRLRLANVHSG